MRAGEGRLLGGVASGIAAHLGLPPLVLRLAFVALTLAGGIGIGMYAAFWLLLPQSAAPVRRPDTGRAQLVALGAVTVGGVLLLQAADLFSPVLLPLVFAGVGVGLVWQSADDAQRARWRTAGGRRSSLLAVVGGAVLLVLGLTGFLATIGQLGQARDGLLSTLVVVVGLGLLTGPWWVRISADLRAERRERIRSQERAEVAAHVHDSVLQTLALIRRAADDPREVTRLARTQERELRTWLYTPTAPQELSFAGALEQVAAEVEEAHGVTVDTVVVGDCPTDPHLLATVAAAREALGNSARHSGATTVSLYAEVSDDRVEVFVRDRGKGFDPALVPDDRFGVSQSVVGRMERHGGRARVRSTPGSGTEVHLEVRHG
ncbi:MAG: putative signal transduction histidine kinase [Frankiales bacterium]|nr:putative signal transduction histidine kinase [Frankiales bacterium]